MNSEIFERHTESEKASFDLANREQQAFRGVLGRLGEAAKGKAAKIATLCTAMTVGLGAMAQEASAEPDPQEFLQSLDKFAKFAEKTGGKSGKVKKPAAPKLPETGPKVLDWDKISRSPVEERMKREQAEMPVAGVPRPGEKPSIPDAKELARDVRMQDAIRRLGELYSMLPEEEEETVLE